MNIKKLTQEAKDELLETIIDKLDELDCEDFFGSNGWKYFFGIDD
jgi:hypothetical protein